MTHPDASAWLLAVELDGGARPREWTRAVTALERAGVDLVTFPDALAPRRTVEQTTTLGSDELDAVQLAAFLATRTETIGLMPTTNVTETEPFHISTAVATLDYACQGRAGVLVRVGTPTEARNVGMRPPARTADETTGLRREATDAVSVIRALWDSWEDDAIIRDTSTGRFIDRDRLHYIDFVGETFSVKGPAIIPRPPQGRPPIAVEVTDLGAARWAADHADIAFLPSAAHVDLLAATRDGREGREAPSPGPRVVVDVHLDESVDGVVAHSEDATTAWVRSALAPLAEGADGIRLRPDRGILAVNSLVDTLIPRLLAAATSHRAGATAPNPTAARARSLRDRIGRSRPASRYAPTSTENDS